MTSTETTKVYSLMCSKAYFTLEEAYSFVRELESYRYDNLKNLENFYKFEQNDIVDLENEGYHTLREIQIDFGVFLIIAIK